MSITDQQTRPANTVPPASAADLLAGLASNLESLNQEIEKEFFGIGAKLIACISTVNAMSSSLSSLASLASGDHGTRAAEALTAALNLSGGMQVRAEEGKCQFGKMRQEADRLGNTLADFSKTAAAFNELGLQTRTETRRLRDAGFDLSNLADDVRFLALNVRKKVENALQTAAELTPRIDTALGEVAKLQEEQAKDLNLVISQVSTSLAEFRSMQQRAHQGSILLGNEYRELSNSFKKLVVCLQFHDITRQRLEHIIDALRRVSTYYREEKPDTPHQSDTAAAALELQSLQLADTAEKFEAAVSSVVLNLDDIVIHVQRMVAEGRALAGLSGDDKTPFFLQMEKGCGLILSSLNDCAAAESAAFVTTTALIEIITRSRASIEDIRVIEIQMQRTAIHAKASATQIGERANKLGELAESIGTRASESSRASHALMEMLDSLSDLANHSCGQEQPQAFSESMAHQQCLDRMRMAVADLRQSDENSCRQLGDITNRGGALSQDLTATRASFSIGAHFANTVLQVQNKLAEIKEEARTVAADTGSEAVSLGMAEFVRHYTMQGEVDIYQGLMRALGTPVVIDDADDLTGTAPPEDDLFGDNVELF